MNNMEKRHIYLFAIVGIGLYLFSTGISYAVFSKFAKSSGAPSSNATTHLSKSAEGVPVFDDTLPKTESCPLNGKLYSKPQREWWEKHRPLGIMIENHQESRPQSGLSSADIVYEAVAEGGITRFLAIFYCQDGGTVGPVRSARTYFLDFVSEYGDSPLYAHVGGANTPGPANALGQIEDYGWVSYNDLNQFSVGFPTFWRDYERIGHEVATEHTMYSTTAKLWKAGESRGLTEVDKKGSEWDEEFKSFTFKDDESQSSRPDAQTIQFAFWEGYSEYAVKWLYDKASNVYKRENGGVKHTDLNDKKQFEASNVVALFMTERHANDGYEDNAHLLYGTKGRGDAVIFMDGKEVKGTWEKKDRESRMIIKNSKGSEVKFNKGVIWFEILPLGTKIES